MIKFGTTPIAFMHKQDSLKWATPSTGDVRIVNTEYEDFIQLVGLKDISQSSGTNLEFKYDCATYHPLSIEKLWKEFLDTGGEQNHYAAFILKYGPLFSTVYDGDLISLSDCSTLYSDLSGLVHAWDVYCTNIKSIQKRGRFNEELPIPGFTNEDDGGTYLTSVIHRLLKRYSIIADLPNEVQRTPYTHFRPGCLADALVLQLLHFSLNNLHSVKNCKGPGCNETFIAVRSTGKYCSNACRQRHYDHQKNNPTDHSGWE